MEDFSLYIVPSPSFYWQFLRQIQWHLWIPAFVNAIHFHIQTFVSQIITILHRSNALIFTTISWYWPISTYHHKLSLLFLISYNMCLVIYLTFHF